MAKEREPLPWARWSFDDFFEDPAVVQMTNQQVGGYLRLLHAAWKSDPPGYLTSDGKFLSARSGLKPWSVHGPILARAFDTTQDGLWIQKRIVREYDAAGRLSATRSEAGMAGAMARHGKLKQMPSKPMAIAYERERGEGDVDLRENLESTPAHTVRLAPDGVCVPDSTPTNGEAPHPTNGNGALRTKPNPRRPDAAPEGFREFYDPYPRHIAPRRAWIAYAQLRKRYPKLSVEDLAWAAEQFAEECRKDSTPEKKIPYPATWLNDDAFTSHFEEVGNDRVPPRSN